jgi:Tfp pilus assembly protein PilF
MTVQDHSDRSQREFLRERDKRRSGLRFVVLTTVAVLLAGLAAYKLKFQADMKSKPPASPVDSQDSAKSEPEDRWHQSEFVGSQTCAECHSDIAETYLSHPMANTLASISSTTATEIKDGESREFEAQGCSYRVERLGDRLIHTEFMNDSAGKRIYEQSVDVKYAVGSGENAKTYLIDRGGLMFESPITWYSEKKIWDLSPGYHENPRQRFNRRVTDGCVQCHSGRVAATGEGNSNRFEEQPFPELGVGCERCHGPGKRHAEKFAVGGVDGENADDMLIVNPARLDRRLEESVCYQCHMGGKGRILRKGKSYHDFQPGMATEDIWTVFVAQTPFAEDGTPRFTSHVEQMQSSACFRGAEERMRCTTCHDPHQAPKPDERAAFYRTRCDSCHSDHGCSLPIEEREAPPASNSCIHCHMPKLGSSDIPHTSGSDHRVLRNPLNDPRVVDHSEQGAIWTIFDDSDQRMPDWEVERARALAMSDQAMDESDLQLMRQAAKALEVVLARDPYDVEALSKLCFFYCDARNFSKATSLFETALQVDPHHEMSLKNLGMVALQAGSFDVARRSFESYLDVNKWDGTMFGPYAATLANIGDLQAAVEVAERGLLLDPTQSKLRSLAAQLYARIGNRQKSLQHREILLEISSQLDPWDQKRLERKRDEMQKSLKRDP